MLYVIHNFLHALAPSMIGSIMPDTLNPNDTYLLWRCVYIISMPSCICYIFENRNRTSSMIQLYAESWAINLMPAGKSPGSAAPM
jgi:hypothetical protein